MFSISSIGSGKSTHQSSSSPQIRPDLASLPTHPPVLHIFDMMWLLYPSILLFLHLLTLVASFLWVWRLPVCHLISGPTWRWCWPDVGMYRSLWICLAWLLTLILLAVRGILNILQANHSAVDSSTCLIAVIRIHGSHAHSRMDSISRCKTGSPASIWWPADMRPCPEPTPWSHAPLLLHVIAVVQN